MEASTINIRLKQLRKESRITQEQMAEYLGVDQSLINDAYIPLNFAFRSNGIQSEDLESIAVVNKIAMNIRYMNELLGDE